MGPQEKLRFMLNLDSLPNTQRAFRIPGDSDNEYFYDIWSNIHFGYVGRAAGFSGSVLQWGAARGGSAGVNDPMDVETMQIGIDLWDRYGSSLTQKQLIEEILIRKGRLLQIQNTSAYLRTLGNYPNFRHVQPITDGE
jgi:Bacterial toxin 44